VTLLALRSQYTNTAVWTALLVTSYFVVQKRAGGKSKYFKLKFGYNLDTLQYFEPSVITAENICICSPTRDKQLPTCRDSLTSLFHSLNIQVLFNLINLLFNGDNLLLILS